MCVNRVPPKDGDGQTVVGVLTLMLKPQYVLKGYHLLEDEDFVYLTGPTLTTPAVFSAYGAHLEDIERHIDNLEAAQCKS